MVRVISFEVVQLARMIANKAVRKYRIITMLFILHNRHRYLLSLLLRFVHHLVEFFKGRATI